MKVVLYRRISIARGDGESLDAQHAKLLAYAAREGAEIVGDFADDGISGGTMADRPGVLDALAVATRTKAILVTTAISRLGRSTSQVLWAIEELKKAGAAYISTGEGLDTRSQVGELLLTILAAVATWELSAIRGRTTAVLGHMRKSNRRISFYEPMGSRFDDEKRMLIDVPEEQMILKNFEQQRAAGASYGKIAADANRLGIRAKRGGPWSPRTVRLVLIRRQKLGAAA